MIIRTGINFDYSKYRSWNLFLKLSKLLLVSWKFIWSKEYPDSCRESGIKLNQGEMLSLEKFRQRINLIPYISYLISIY